MERFPLSRRYTVPSHARTLRSERGWRIRWWLAACDDPMCPTPGCTMRVESWANGVDIVTHEWTEDRS